MASLNECKLIGHVGEDPKVTTLQTGTKVANISIATSEKFKVGEEVKERTEWHRVVVWNALAEIVEKFVHKGSQIYICGQLRTRSWDKDGVKHYVTEIYAKEILLLGNKNGNSNSNAQASQQAEIINQTSNKAKETVTTSETAPSGPDDVLNDPHDDLPF